MTDATTFTLQPAAEATGEPPRRRAGWPLMGDVASARAGVPELLIQWRRAQGLADPAPMLDPGDQAKG